MVKDDCVRNLAAILEPLIENLDDDKITLANRKNELESVSRLIAYTKDNIEMVGIYADQDLIIDNLDKLEYSKEDYKASCYLLKSEDENVKTLPQYEKAYNLISDIIEFFKLHKAELIVEIQDLTTICEKEELEKKYYDILSSSNPFVEDVDEFTKFVNEHVEDNEEIINILYSTIRSNIANYKSRNN